jgi:hypothetical protein
MKRYLTWHFPEGSHSNGSEAYYVDKAYSPYAVRIHAVTAPTTSDAEFEILSDDVSIMSNRNVVRRDSYGRITSNTTATSIVLTKGETSNEAADDFSDDEIETETWLTCTMTNGGGGKNFIVQLELEAPDDEIDE